MRRRRIPHRTRPTPDRGGHAPTEHGEVADARNWDATERPRAENRFRDHLTRGGEYARTPLLGGDSPNDVIERYCEILKTYIRY
jgi:hypothetical protein